MYPIIDNTVRFLHCFCACDPLDDADLIQEKVRCNKSKLSSGDDLLCLPIVTHFQQVLTRGQEDGQTMYQKTTES